ncbi:hypothetical protein GF406_09815 [candidate division KSB1 bacterium]|nr:hypothetical protein [candidate division KSB1 bacterium]
MIHLFKRILFKPVYNRWDSLVNRLRKNEKIIHELQNRLRTQEQITEYLIESPIFNQAQNVGFNGQIQRKQIFKGLMNTFPIQSIVETGTWVGNTAGYMVIETGIPVNTVEVNPHIYRLARKRLENYANIFIYQGNSPEFLHRLAETEIADLFTFFYLDAHWGTTLPLKDEITLICNAWKRYIIMIDDFQVPGDDGYRYDSYYNYGPLSLSTFGDLFSKYNLIPFYPAAPSAEETGSKAGCVVLFMEKDVKTAESCNSLVKYHRTEAH